MASQARRVTASLKARAAMRVVATPSKLSRREAVAAAVSRKLNSKTIGAAMPPARIAPASQGISSLPSGVSERTSVPHDHCTPFRL